MALSWTVAVLLGILQGLLEWLPISSEGYVTLVLSALLEVDPLVAVQLSLFLHLGTAVAAAAYYRSPLADLLQTIRSVGGPESVSRERWATLWFLAVGTVASGLVGIAVYAALKAVLVGLPTRLFVAVIGALLVLTGALQRYSGGGDAVGRRLPTVLDAVLVGVGQGLALLPGVSRSGTTVSLLLLRRYEEEQSLELSFVLAIPASLGAGVLVVLDIGGLPSIAPGPAGAAIIASAVVGFLTIGALVRLVRVVPFWLVCVGFGGVVLGSALL
ncbi:MAG: undecaprenyl-diphosphate phosphatase [Halodesulfurarchaeum sp.]